MNKEKSSVKKVVDEASHTKNEVNKKTTLNNDIKTSELDSNKINAASEKKENSNNSTLPTNSFIKHFKPKNYYSNKRRRKFCKLCAKGIERIDYKNIDLLKKYLNQHLKIIPSRISGACSTHQRRISNAIKRARIVALIPFVPL